jgi:serine/threonine protein kinase
MELSGRVDVKVVEPRTLRGDHMNTALNWTLGPYRIVREIGRGQFGTVYEATDGSGRQIALKLVPIEGIDGDEKVAAERQGAALQQRFSGLSNHLVPDVIDHQRIDPYYAIAMELVTGEPLTAVIKAGPLPDRRAATIAVAISQFLELAHEFTTNIVDHSETPIVHGDLKPAHILLLADGSVRVLDFGIAKALAAQKPATTNIWASLDYASPERLESGRVNEHVDFWSLGVILFEMLAGVRPYRDYEHNRSHLDTAIRRQEPRLRLPHSVDPRLAAIVNKLLAPQIERRYQSARQIGQDLQAFLSGEPVVAFAEMARADQATVRVPAAAHGISPREPVGPTERVPPAPQPVHVAMAPVGNTPLVANQGAPTASPVSQSPAITVSPSTVSPPTTGRLYKPWIAAVLSFLIPGFGELYNRDFLRAVVWLIITPGFWIGSGGTLGWLCHLISSYTAYQGAREMAMNPASSSASRRMPFVRGRAAA